MTQEYTHRHYYFNYKITFMCNQNCNYCYEMKASKDIWNNYALPWAQVQRDFILFKKLKLPSTIEILGGEPLLYPRLNKLLDWCYKEIPWHQIAISTNATGRRIKDLKLTNEVLNNILWMFSFHGKNTNIKLFIENIKFMLFNKIKFQINIMLGVDLGINIDKLLDFLNSLSPEDKSFIEISLLELWDPKSGDSINLDKTQHESNIKIKEAIADFDHVDDKHYENLCMYNEVFIDKGRVQSPECVLDLNNIPFDINFISELKEFNPRKCPFDMCVVENAERCRA